MLAESDCEHCRPGLVSQPVNTVSSLAYVAAGADLLRRPNPDRAFAWAVISVGIGSDLVFTLFFAGLVWLMAAVIAQGQTLAEENEGFV